MKLSQLIEHVATFDSARNFLQQWLILRREIPACTVCDRPMSTVKCTTSKDDVLYRCPTHKGQKVSIREGRFLAGHHISLKDFILLAFFWAHESRVTSTSEMLGLHENTVVQWFSYFRDACSNYLVRHPIQIGGVDSVVEIDESVMARRKYHRGHQVPERWVFGGIDPATNVGFLVMVADRSAATLLPLIEQFIVPGTMIHSDQWAAYNNIQNINVNPPYHHLTVNHTENFVAPATGATTNHVECMWKNCKSKFKSMNGCHSSMLSGHLDEFMWRQQRGRTHAAAFENLLRAISEWYPTP